VHITEMSPDDFSATRTTTAVSDIKSRRFDDELE